MHTREIGKLRVHYNSDWSGEAIIQAEGKEPLRVDAREFACLCVMVATRMLEVKLDELDDLRLDDP